MRDITLAELLKAGVHFGHQVSRWHPKMKPYIFTARNGIYIIDLEKTKSKLEAAAKFASQVCAEGGSILFVGTKRQAKEIIEREAKKLGMPYVSNRWIGGTFTNFPTISKLIAKFKKLKTQREGGELEKYTKKERLMIDREIDNLQELVGGITELEKLPAALFVVDLKQERTAVKEARKMNIPIIAIADTNVNPDEITHIIPSNDDATKAIDLIISVIAEGIEQGTAIAQEAAKQAEASEMERAKKKKDEQADKDNQSKLLKQ
ncbi:MAG: 30S ribosomal protein S2 [bacterium]